MARIRFTGIEDAGLKISPSGVNEKLGIVGVSVKEGFRADSRRSGVDKVVETGEIDTSDIIEITLEDGIRVWRTFEELESLSTHTGRSQSTPGVIELGSTFPTQSTSRGYTGKAIKAMRVLGIDPTNDGAVLVAKKVDAHLVRETTLLQISGINPEEKKRPYELKPINQVSITSGKKALIFLHGTLSNTNGSFGDLVTENGGKIWSAIKNEYGDNILALEHYTLTESPIANALKLLQSLPHKNMELHFVSHSRGGLVGEVISRCMKAGPAFEEVDFEIYEKGSKGKPDSKRRADLEDLQSELEKRAPRVTRFVRVAAPAAGTTLATKKLDTWLEVMVNGIGKLTGLSNNPFYDVPLSLLLAVKSQSTNSDVMPGLVSMMPSSSTVRMLNRPDVVLEKSEPPFLSIIAGDTEGSGFFGSLAVAVTDLFYRQDHDLVVDTRSMYGGAGRPENCARYLFDRGSEVNHFSYFRNPKTAESLLDALVDSPETLDKSSFTKLGETRRKRARFERSVMSGRIARSKNPKSVIYLLPGIMGSHLSVGNGKRKIWLDLLELADGGIKTIDIGEEPGDLSSGLVSSAYADLVDYLKASHEVIEFPYDWRLSIEDTANRLADSIEERLTKDKLPIRILAHSMGGLVARGLIAYREHVWKKMRDLRHGRLVMLGTPNRGSHIIPRLLVGRERIVRMLSLADLKNSQADILETIAKFPGVLEMLPDHGDEPWFTEDWWKRLKKIDDEEWTVPTQSRLDDAKAVAEKIWDSPIDENFMAYVAGCARSTPSEIYLNDDTIAFQGTEEGDGRVLWDTGIPGGLSPYYIDTKHGNLADHRRSFRGIEELLESGFTTKLKTHPPMRRSLAGKRFQLEDDVAGTYPDQDFLESVILDHEYPSEVAATKAERIKVSVVHGNLAFSRNPVIVGHYLGDPILHAERDLDHQLPGRPLSTRYSLGRYPGKLGSSAIVLNPDSKPGGGIIVGLGEVGSLTPQDLMIAVRDALLDYASEESERLTKEQRPGYDAINTSITTLMIGSGEGGVQLGDSIASILEAAVSANRSLSRSTLATKFQFSGIEFIDLYQDVAIRALKAVREICENDLRLKHEIEFHKRIVPLSGGLKRVHFEESTGWWRRFIIREMPDGITITNPGERARAEICPVNVLRENLEGPVSTAINEASWNPTLSSALFELLVPDFLKGSALDNRDTVLLLNPGAAFYPWEMIRDRSKDEDGSLNEPISCRFGIIRQLETARFRTNAEYCTELKAIVIGNPPSPYNDLPGAEREAHSAADSLAMYGYQVNRDQIGQNATRVTENFFGEDYRIVHIAAHGIYDPTSPGNTGVVIGTKPASSPQDGKVQPPLPQVLTPGMMKQLRVVPEFVFLNCCYLGETDEPLDRNRKRWNELAANVSAQLIEEGVKCIIAAGWAVDDEAALDFSEVFYQGFLNGKCFGDAVREARRYIFDIHGDHSNTWGAYQCYGDYGFKLTPGDLSSYESPEPPEFSCSDELLVELENIKQGASTEKNIPRQKQKLDTLAGGKSYQGCWKDNGRILEAFGHACFALEEFEKAVGYFNRALKCECELATGAAEEQLALAKLKWVEKRSDAGDLKEEDALAEIDKASGELSALAEKFPSSERFSLLGSAHKRAANISTSISTSRKHLRLMADFYRRAHLHNIEKKKVSPYALGNWLTSVITLNLLSPNKLPEKWASGETITQNLREAGLLAGEIAKQGGTFWDAVGPLDITLSRLMHENNHQANEWKDLAESYVDVLRTKASPFEVHSVISHLESFSKLLSQAKSSTSKKVKNALNAVACINEVTQAIRDAQSNGWKD